MKVNDRDWSVTDTVTSPKAYIEKERALQLLEENASDDEVFFAARAIEAEPAVPQEMSAREYEKAFQRITYEDVETYRVWWEAIHDEDWGRAVAIVEAWAKEHPEERSEE